MKVLHAYSKDSPRLARYVSLLIQAMPPDVECAFADNASDLRRGCQEYQPDIIHQHGRFPAVWTDGRVCPHKTPRLIVSPHGEPTDNENAYAVIARSPYELQHLDTPRKVLVRNPLITTTITFEEAAETIRALYRRVMDSHPLELMDAATRRALAAMLKAGLLGDKRWVTDSEGQSVSPLTPHLSPLQPDYRHLLIYAGQEGVLDIVGRGISVLGIDIPSGDVAILSQETPSDIYLPENYSMPVAMEGAAVTEMLHDIEQNGATLLRLTELMKALHSDTLDEDALMGQIEAEKQKPIFQAVLQLLAEQMLLTEGFMPCQPLDNTDTQQLRWQLENHLKILTPNS